MPPFNLTNEDIADVLERVAELLTALFSNTAHAHDLGKTRDWVVIYYDQDGHENQCTVVSKHHGPLKGKRVVRGYERECMAYCSGKELS